MCTLQSPSRLLGMLSVATMITTATVQHRLPTPMSPKDGTFLTTIILEYVCMACNKLMHDNVHMSAAACMIYYSRTVLDKFPKLSI